MSTLRITLQPSQYNVKLELGAIANIYDVTSTPKKDKKSLRDQIIRDVTDINLDPGKYLVEAILPSGEAVYDEVNLTDQNETKDIVIGTRSPHEWLAMQHFIGNTRRKVVSDSSIWYSRSRTFTRDALPVQVKAETISVPTQQPSFFTHSWGVLESYFQESRSSLQIPPGRALSTLTNYLSGPSIHAFQPTITDQYERVFEFTSQVLANNQNYFHIDYQSQNFVRHYLVISADSLVPQYCVLPVPWIQDYNQELTIQVLVNLPASISSRDSCSVSIAIPDRRVGAVIGYLGSGLLPTAQKLVKTATDMFYDKMVNPLAAAAGAYVMVFAEQSREQEVWHQWVQNLMNWFTWLPDGAILHAWLKLTYGNKGDLIEARRSLLEAYRRGLPFYSKGVKMLLDGLTLFANDANHSDSEIEDALRVVRRVAMNTNMRQPFTTVSLSQ